MNVEEGRFPSPVMSRGQHLEKMQWLTSYVSAEARVRPHPARLCDREAQASGRNLKKGTLESTPRTLGKSIADYFPILAHIMYYSFMKLMC